VKSLVKCKISQFILLKNKEMFLVSAKKKENKKMDSYYIHKETCKIIFNNVYNIKWMYIDLHFSIVLL